MEKTKNKPIVMGRKTHEAIGRVLKNRDNVVISKNLLYKSSQEVKIKRSVGEVISDYKDCEELMIIGGQQIYEQF